MKVDGTEQGPAGQEPVTEVAAQGQTAEDCANHEVLCFYLLKQVYNFL